MGGNVIGSVRKEELLNGLRTLARVRPDYSEALIAVAHLYGLPFEVQPPMIRPLPLKQIEGQPKRELIVNCE